MKAATKSLVAGVALAALVVSGAAFAQEPVTLNIWAIDGRDGKAGMADTFAAEFDAMNDDIVVNYRLIPSNELVNETLRAYSTGQAPDLVSLDNPDFALFSSRGAMVDITDRVAESDAINIDAYYPGPLETVTWEGRLYGLPRYNNTIAVFYNKEMFAAAGITEPPKTWAEFAEYAAKLTDPENDVYGATWSARAAGEGPFQFLPHIQMSGGDYANVNTEGAARSLDMFKSLIDNGYASRDVLNRGQGDSTSTFNAGNAAMAVSGPWEINRMLNDADFDWGVALLPTLEPDGVRSSALGGFVWGIMSTTEHPDEAFRALEYFTSQTHRMFPEFGEIPARGDIELPPTGIPQKDEALAVFQEQLRYAQPRGPHPEWPKIAEAIWTAIHAALTGEVSSKEALDTAQATIETVVN